MKKITLILFLIFVFLYPIPYTLYPSHADEIEDLQKQINELSSAREQSVKATKPLEGQLDSLKRQLAQIQAQLDNLSFSIKQKEKDLAVREEKAAMKQAIMETRVRSFYVRSFFASPLLVILSSGSSGDLFRELAFRQSAAKDDRNVIISVTEEIKDLLTQKEKLEKDKVVMASLQAQVDKNADFIGGEVKKAKTYQAELSSKIVALSARQQQIISQRQASLNLPSSLGAGPLFCTDDRNLNPGFSPSFAFFTYGIPHRVGMNQYGAYGRAKAGQSHEDILRAYFDNFNFETKSNIGIKVQGYGEMPIETYLLGIYEVPESWGDSGGFEALKAQAVAARSYALAATGDGAGNICATESCQVYKPVNKGGAWDAAVEATRGWVLVTGGKPFSAWYASTAGGYTFGYSAQGYSTPNLWDTPGGQGGWPNSAYEIVGGSPWFYKGWYKSRSGASCGRGNPWLTSTEMADILNARYVLDGGGGDAGRILPVDTDCWGGNPYSVSELQGIGGYTSVSGVNVVYGNDGSTASVTFSTNKGSVTVSGAKYKEAFNLRAPGYIGLKSSLFNIEKL